MTPPQLCSKCSQPLEKPKIHRAKFVCLKCQVESNKKRNREWQRKKLSAGTVLTPPLDLID